MKHTASTMTYSEFAAQPPVLFGQMRFNGKNKIGIFKPVWYGLTNSLMYIYHSPKGKKGQGGFTLKRAFEYLERNTLSTNPADGNPNNYL